MKQLRWTLLLLSLLLDLTGSSVEEKAEEVIGALGESVTFQLKFFVPFRTIYWLRTKRNGGSSVVVVLNPEKNCAAIAVLSDFKGRLNVSEDCKRLEVKNLNQDDSGTYQAQIQLRGVIDLLDLYFDLHVYKRLSEADLSIRCNRTANGTWRLSCSAELWEDGTKFGMALGNQREYPGRSFDIRNNLEESNLNVTCVAENPVSNASRMESLKEICDETAVFLSVPGYSGAFVGTTAAVALIVAKVFISGCVFARWPCCSLGMEGYPKGTRPRGTT